MMTVRQIRRAGWLFSGSLVTVATLIWIFSVSCTENTIITRPVKPAKNIRVPTNAVTIQEALDRADPGDTITLMDGVYRGKGNRDIDLGGKEIVITSENGPGTTIIDCEGRSSDWHFGFRLSSGENRAVINGLTIKNAVNSLGAAIFCQSSSPTISNCIFVNNRAEVAGGAIRCKAASPTIVNCTFVGNYAMAGGTVFCIASSSPHFSKCIIYGSKQGGSVYVSDGSSRPTFDCCNIFGNVGGDWVAKIIGHAAINGNFSADPLFCNADVLDYGLQQSSPCAPANNSCNQLIGALNADCP